MKKIIILILCLSIIFIPKVYAKEKVNVYLFWEYGCSICENAKDFFKKLEKEYHDYYELKLYEVWYNEETSDNAKEINISSYINNQGLKGKYNIYLKINDKIFATKKYVIFE